MSEEDCLWRVHPVAEASGVVHKCLLLLSGTQARDVGCWVSLAARGILSVVPPPEQI